MRARKLLHDATLWQSRRSVRPVSRNRRVRAAGGHALRITFIGRDVYMAATVNARWKLTKMWWYRQGDTKESCQRDFSFVGSKGSLCAQTHGWLSADVIGIRILPFPCFIMSVHNVVLFEIRGENFSRDRYKVKMRLTLYMRWRIGSLRIFRSVNYSIGRLFM